MNVQKLVKKMIFYLFKNLIRYIILFVERRSIMTIDKKLLEVPKGGRPKRELSDNELLQLLVRRQQMSSKAIAADMDVSVSTVNRWLRLARARYAEATETRDIKEA